MDQIFFMGQQGKYFQSKNDLCLFKPWVEYYRAEYFFYDAIIYHFDVNPNAVFVGQAHPEYEHNLFQRSWLFNFIEPVTRRATGALADVAARGRFVLGNVDQNIIDKVSN